jgi:hypothetical protein
MNGMVDDYGRALVVLSIRPTEQAASIDLTVWIDTQLYHRLVWRRASG